MKKNSIAFITVLILTALAIIIWIASDSNKLKSLDITDVKEITIHNSGEYYTITETDDIQLLFQVLQSMKLRRTLSRDKDGFAFLIDIELKSGNMENLSILSGDINMNGHHYKPDKDYCDMIREVFEKLSEKYKIIFCLAYKHIL